VAAWPSGLFVESQGPTHAGRDLSDLLGGVGALLVVELEPQLEVKTHFRVRLVVLLGDFGETTGETHAGRSVAADDAFEQAVQVRVVLGGLLLFGLFQHWHISCSLYSETHYGEVVSIYL